MRLTVVISLLVFTIFAAEPALAQNEPRVDGGKYVLHTVTRKETIYSLCQQYHLTLQELEAANPGLGGVLQAGTTLKIPVQKTVEEPAHQQPDAEFYYHKVQKKQTLYSIARQYEISENDIIRYNPFVAEGLKLGQILRIPVKPSGDEPVPVSAQKSVAPGADNFRKHQVVSGETLFGLEKQYGISDDEMQRLNPELKNGLKTGMILRIPVKPEQLQPEFQPAAQSGSSYQVEKGETIFSISSRFGVSVSDLKKANPALYSRGVQAGETLLIPDQSAPAVPESVSVQNQENTMQRVPENPNCLPDPAASNKKYKVALMLPLYLGDKAGGALDSTAVDSSSRNNGNDSSSLFSPIFFNNQRIASGADTAVVAGGVTINPKAVGFLEFYEGAVLALDSARRAGINIEMYVFDANNRRQVINLLQHREFLEMSLIIGPVYPELQSIVSAFSAKNRIPVVSPLSNAGSLEQTNSWYMKVVPNRDFQIDQTARYIAQEFRNKKFFLINEPGVNPSSPEARLGQLCQQNFADGASKRLFHEYDFQQQGVSDIKPLLSRNADNVFVIPSDNEAQISVAVSNMDALAGDYPLILMGTPTIAKMKSIQTESYHDIRLRYLSPYYVDYSRPLVRRFVSRYRDMFAGEPTQFSFQGFDVTLYFMSALSRYGKDFRGCLPDFPMKLTQMNFDFRKVAPMGGYVNQSLFVVSYERNFDILNYGVFEPKN